MSPRFRTRPLVATLLLGFAFAPLPVWALVDLAPWERVVVDVAAHLRRVDAGTESRHTRRVATTYGWGCGSDFPPFVDARTPTQAEHDDQLLTIDPTSPSPPPTGTRYAIFELEGQYTGRATIEGQSCARRVPRFRVERWCYVGAPDSCRALRAQLAANGDEEVLLRVQADCAPDPSWPRCDR